jgi:hypothetical protein
MGVGFLFHEVENGRPARVPGAISTQTGRSFIVVVNFMCQHHGLRNVKISGQTLFLGMSPRVFSEEISI